LRAAAAERLTLEGMPRERVLACAVRLLDRGFFRVGGEEYAADNGSYGLATLEKGHVSLAGDGLLVFDYVAKSGKRRLQAVVDPEVFDVVAELKRRRGGGPELLAYKNGRWADVRSSDINDFIKELTGADFSAKDFRTWHATVLASVALAVSEAATSKTGRKRAVTRAVAEVAHYLGNTPAVCRASYIDARVFDRYRAGETIAAAIENVGWESASDAPPPTQAVERAVLRLLDC
jgi:DNA topoisomerase IB